MRKVIYFFIIFFLLSSSFVLAENISFQELNKQIQEKKTKIEALQAKTKSYQNKIQAYQSEAVNLKNQTAILDNQIAKTNLDLQTSQEQIETTKLEIQSADLEIKEKENKIKNEKEQLSQFIRKIYQYDQKNSLEVLLLNDSFSDFFNQLQYLENIQSSLGKVLGKVKALKKELESKKEDLIKKKTDLDKLVKQLKEDYLRLAANKGVKESLINETQFQESKFQNLLLGLRYEEQRVNNEIASLEQTIRKKLEESDKSFTQGRGGETIFSWPVPNNGITAGFHDPSYPFRYIFEHSAIDIAASQGDSIIAPAPGYVGRARDAGMGYSYLMLIHANGISTVYGHVSKILVKEDSYVSRGQVIAKAGGMPGTPGAGRLTTGPHLHFEVRLNGIPVNPLEYLP